MSASPSNQFNGQASTPNNGPSQFIRRPKPADPLRPRKKPLPKRPQNGVIRKPNGPNATVSGPVGIYPVNGLAPTATSSYAQHGPSPSDPDGWSTRPRGDHHDFPLLTTKQTVRDGVRYHIARFTAKKDVDPSSQEQFTRPVSLHRRDPKQERGVKEEPIPDGPLDSKEREKQEILRAEKEKQRAIDLAQIAPTGNNPSALAAKKSQSFRNEKTSQVLRVDKTAEQKKASDLRYEEALPWHLEDADNKNTWVGNYEAALSSTNVLFVVDGSTFRMIPVEKWYKFIAKGQFKTFTSEEAEARMNRKVKESRWVMKSNEQKVVEREAQDTRRAMHKLYTVKAESTTFKNSGKRETEDMDELDFDGDDLFQDDDEQATVEPDKDEDTKEAQDRIKKDQLAANVFNQTNEADVDLEAEEEKKEKEKTKMLGKSVKKALKKRERNLIYDSDASDHNPYSEESEDDTSDEEKQKEIDRKKDEEAKNKAKQESKLPPDASSKGTSTPSARQKQADTLKKMPGSLKRPGGDVSESSGNESSRKKQKKKHHNSTGTSTPVLDARQASTVPLHIPGQSARKTSIVKLNVAPSKLSDIQSAPPNPSPANVGVVSDGEGTGGEASDGTKKTKLKLRLGHSPTSSRQTSPEHVRAASIGVGSRAGSPALRLSEHGTSPHSSSDLGPIQPHEIIAALPDSGITIGDLMKLFQARVGTNNKTERAEFIKLVKENSKYGGDKLLRRKEVS